VSAHQTFQSGGAALEQPPRPNDRPHRALKGWRTVKELREELRFPSDAAVREWLRRSKIVGVRRGRVILVDGLDVDHQLRHGALRRRDHGTGRSASLLKRVG
jgi:hypothetical protein